MSSIHAQLDLLLDNSESPSAQQLVTLCESERNTVLPQTSLSIQEFVDTYSRINITSATSWPRLPNDLPREENSRDEPTRFVRPSSLPREKNPWDDPIKCDFAGCDRHFENKRLLRSHKQKAHTGFQCPRCPDSGLFQTIGQLIEHRSVVHLGFIPSQCPLQTCQRKGFVYKYKHSLANHLRVVHHTSMKELGEAGKQHGQDGETDDCTRMALLG